MRIKKGLYDVIVLIINLTFSTKFDRLCVRPHVLVW